MVEKADHSEGGLMSIKEPYTDEEVEAILEHALLLIQSATQIDRSAPRCRYLKDLSRGKCTFLGCEVAGSSFIALSHDHATAPSCLPRLPRHQIQAGAR